MAFKKNNSIMNRKYNLVPNNTHGCDINKHNFYYTYSNRITVK